MTKKTEDIFSFKKIKETCPNPKIPIIVDSREKNSLVLANLLEKKANVESKKLEVGDYLVGTVVIERKTKTDLYNSLTSNRLKEQLHNLKQHKNPLLIVEEDNNEFASNKKNILESLRLSIAAHHQIPIIDTNSETQTAETLIKLAKKEKKDSKINVQKIAKTKNEQKRFILEAFPGVGAKASQKLLKHFSSLQEIFNASQETIENITNKKIAENFEDLLN